MAASSADGKTEVPATASGKSTEVPKRKGKAWNVVGYVLIAVVILAFLPLPLLHLAGYSAYSVVSGSMEPTIPTGSLVLVQQETPDKIQLGDVVAFNNSGSVVTHRAVDIDNAAKMILTKGDANAKPDMYPVPFSAIDGVVVAHVPGLGHAYQLITGLWGKVVGVALVVLAVGCFSLGRRRS